MDTVPHSVCDTCFHFLTLHLTRHRHKNGKRMDEQVHLSLLFGVDFGNREAYHLSRKY